MRSVFHLFCFVLLSPALISQQADNPTAGSRLLFPPLIAHHVEPRVGFTRLVDEQRLRLDIGNSIDLVEFDQVFADDRLSLGADFFTWTSLRQEGDFHFPVDAVDYLFGINVSWRQQLRPTSAVSARLRLSHISAHLVDGSYDKTQRAWRDGQLPLVYSREFIDLVIAWEYGSFLRLYGGGQYIYHIDPEELGRMGLQAGGEVVWRDALSAGTHLYAAYDVRLVHVGAPRSAHGLQLGAKIGDWRGRGLNLLLAWYHGPSQHGEYFDRMWSYWGPGMNIDF